MKERCNREFGEFKRWKVDGKSMDGAILPECNYNDSGKKYLGKCRGLKLRICYNYKTLDRFVKDCLFTRSDGRLQLIALNDKNFV